MKPVLLLCALLCAGLAACTQSEDPKQSQSSQPKEGNPLTAPVDYLGAVGKAKNAAEKTVDLTSLNRTIQLFHASEDRFPKDLNELVQTRYLPRLPDPPRGLRLVYNPSNGQVTLARE